MSRARLLRVLVAAAVAAVLLCVYAVSTTRGGHGLPCPLLLLTGWRCPVCGMTRAAVALLGADLPTAFACNALWPVYAAYLSWVAASDAVAYVRRGEIRLLPKPLWIHGAMLAVTVGYGILRNLL